MDGLEEMPVSSVLDISMNLSSFVLEAEKSFDLILRYSDKRRQNSR